jgi:hypothetical protein
MVRAATAGRDDAGQARGSGRAGRGRAMLRRMHVVQFFLPLKDNAGQPFAREVLVRATVACML